MSKKSSFLATKWREKPYAIKEQIFFTDPQNEVWINDAGVSLPYNFVCPNCIKAAMKIEIRSKAPYNFHFFNPNKHQLDQQRLESLGGPGHCFQLWECQSCFSLYYIGFRIIEPNNGRDVFVLHTILELNSLDP